MKRRADIGLILGCVTVVVAYAPPAYAYLDAGTGTMLLQAFVAAIAGSVLAVKMYWRRIKLALWRQPIDEESPALDAPIDGDDQV